MAIAETLADIFLDDPGFQFIDCYHSIPVFKKLSQTAETGRFWYAFAVGDDRVIIMGPGFTRLDLSYAVSFLVTHPLLKHHVIACKNDETAGGSIFDTSMI